MLTLSATAQQCDFPLCNGMIFNCTMAWLSTVWQCDVWTMWFSTAWQHDVLLYDGVMYGWRDFLLSGGCDVLMHDGVMYNWGVRCPFEKLRSKNVFARCTTYKLPFGWQNSRAWVSSFPYYWQNTTVSRTNCRNTLLGEYTVGRTQQWHNMLSAIYHRHNALQHYTNGTR